MVRIRTVSRDAEVNRASFPAPHLLQVAAITNVKSAEKRALQPADCVYWKSLSL